MAGTNRPAPWEREQEGRPEKPAVHRQPSPSSARSLSLPGPFACYTHKEGGGRGLCLGPEQRGEKGRAGLGAVHRCGWAWQEERQPDPPTPPLQLYILRHNSLSFPGSSSLGRVLPLSRRELMTQSKDGGGKAGWGRRGWEWRLYRRADRTEQRTARALIQFPKAAELAGGTNSFISSVNFCSLRMREVRAFFPPLFSNSC